MKLICVFVLAVVLLSKVSELVELNCPKGWIIVGQVIYADAYNTTKNAAMCFICRKKTQEDTPFGLIELCMFKSAVFQIGQGNIYRRKQKICEHESESSGATKLNISAVCSKRPRSQICGANISETASIDVPPENVQFLACDQSKLIVIKNNTVDIKCPKNWKFTGIKQQEKTYYKTYQPHHQKSEICVMCNLKHFSIQNKPIFICTTVELFRLKNVLDVVIDSEKSIDVVKKNNNMLTEEPNHYCGYRLNYNNTRYYFNEAQLIMCDEFDTKESSDLKYNVKNSSLIVSLFSLSIDNSTTSLCNLKNMSY
jgi:hypothetical protein